MKRQVKWESRLGARTGRIDWENIHALNSNISYCNNLGFFNLLVVKDNLETNTRSVHYRSPDNLCTFCKLLPETCLHLLWDCTKVRKFRLEANNILKYGPLKNEINLIPNTAKSRLLGNNFKNVANFPFIFLLLMNRYIWLTKLRENELSPNAFKNFSLSFLKLHKLAKSINCFKNLDLEDIWE